MVKFIKYFLIIILLYSCGTYQLAPVDKCCETDVVYLDEIKGDSVNVFTSLDFNTITLDFRPLRPRFYWGHNYGYWGSRPLWMDFDFYYGNHYSYYNPYYSYFNRPWNHWDWYMRPWMPSNNWNQGPFNNQGYNVVYNSGRRSSLTESNRMSIKDKIGQASMIASTKPRVNTKPVIITKPVINTNKPTWNSNNNSNNIIVKPNNNKPIIRNNNSRPSNNYNRPSVNYNNSSVRPSSNTIRVKSTSRGGNSNRKN